LRARRQRDIIVSVLAEQVQELVRVGSDQLSERRVTGAKLLQDWLEHLRLLLNDLSKLLELRVVAKEVKIAKPSLLLRGDSLSSCGSGSGSGVAASPGSASLLSS
jgi:hypothetical protein